MLQNNLISFNYVKSYKSGIMLDLLSKSISYISINHLFFWTLFLFLEKFIVEYSLKNMLNSNSNIRYFTGFNTNMFFKIIIVQSIIILLYFL